jgi:hypothetical protein
MLKKRRAVSDVANFLVGNVPVDSIEKVVKGRWSLTLRRRRMPGLWQENFPRNAGGVVLGNPSATLMRQSKYEASLPLPWVSLLRAARRSELMKRKAAFSVDSEARAAVAASIGGGVDVVSWLTPGQARTERGGHVQIVVVRVK